MARRCAVCIDPERDRIDDELIAGKPFLAISCNARMGRESIRRHAAAGHYAEKLARAKGAQTLSAESLLDRVLRFQRAAEEILADAKRAKRDGAALGAIARLTELLKVEGAVLQAARQAAETVCPRCQHNAELERMTPEEIDDFLLKSWAREYLRNPAGFLEGLRNRAAVEIAERRRIPVTEARGVVDVEEAAAVEKLKERA